jgi:hypothetical protein
MGDKGWGAAYGLKLMQDQEIGRQGEGHEIKGLADRKIFSEAERLEAQCCCHSSK